MIREPLADNAAPAVLSFGVRINGRLPDIRFSRVTVFNVHQR